MRFVSQLMRFPVGAHSQSEAPAGRHAEAMGDGKDRHLHGDISMPGAGPCWSLPPRGQLSMRIWGGQRWGWILRAPQPCGTSVFGFLG